MSAKGNILTSASLKKHVVHTEQTQSPQNTMQCSVMHGGSQSNTECMCGVILHEDNLQSDYSLLRTQGQISSLAIFPP